MNEKELAEALITDSLSRQVQHYGIEGLEEAIYRNYQSNIIARQKILKVYNNMYKKRQK